MGKRRFFSWLWVILTSPSPCRGVPTGVSSTEAALPTYDVGMVTTQLIDYSKDAPFAPVPGIPRVLGISVFYPTINATMTNTTYIPPSTASAISSEYMSGGLDLTAQGLEQLTIPLSPSDASIGAPRNRTAWRTLLFSPASDTSRLFYPHLLRHIASYGFVVITYDTAYDTDVLTLQNGTVLYANGSDYEQNSTQGAILKAVSRAEDASFILDQASNISALIPGCEGSCLNTTHVGMFGHSIGGNAAVTAASRDDRIIGAANYDGALWDSVKDKGLKKPYLLFATQGQGHADPIMQTNLTSWIDIWPKITAPKWWLLFNHSLHYTFSDLPVIVEELGIATTESVRNMTQITTVEARRSEKVIAVYTVAFFNFVFGSRLGRLLKGERPDFPEVEFDSVILHESRNGSFTYIEGYTGMSGPDARFEDDRMLAVNSAALRWEKGCFGIALAAWLGSWLISAMYR